MLNKTYRVAHISYSDSKGGAAIAAYRLNQALRRFKINSKLFVLDKSKKDSELIPKDLKKKGFFFTLRILEIILRKTIYLKSKSIHSFNFFDTDLKIRLKQFNPDILHLHYISSNTISIKEINEFKIPVVWTLHDLWPVLPTAHINYNLLKHEKKNFIQQIIDNFIYAQKQKLKISLFIAPSRWVKSILKNKKKLNKTNTHIIANTLDTNYFKIKKKTQQSDVLNIGYSINGFHQYHKGFDLFIDILNKTLHKCSKKINIHFIGDTDIKKKLNPEILKNKNLKIFEYSKTNSFKSILKFYSNLDLILITSRSETFCQVATESMSCGIPVVAFNIGGLKDIIIHNKNGWLVPSFDTSNFSRILIKLINNNHLVKKKSVFCRNNAVSKYDYFSISKKMNNIYNNLLKANK